MATKKTKEDVGECEEALSAAERAADDAWELLADLSGKDLQEERDAVRDAIDALAKAAGIER